ncbi:MAG: DUF4199 domain-containing protein [Bacteroidota bacterium]|nr:DUF4199 domain-containing protein [Bacteroidota bacterium]
METVNLFRNDGLFDNEQFRRNNSDKSMQKICWRNGILTSMLLIASFLGLCAFTHRLEINQLSVVNLLILAVGVYFALEEFSPTGSGNSLDYFEGFKVGLYTSIAAVLIHALVILIYTSFDPSILSQIRAGTFFTFNANPFVAAGITLFEGLACGLIITFCMMQYFKKN